MPLRWSSRGRAARWRCPDAEALAEAAAAMEAAGGRALVVFADVSEQGTVSAAHRIFARGLGAVDSLVNSAGANALQRFWQDLSPADMARMVDMHLKGPSLCSLLVLPAMQARRRGRLIHIVSDAAAGIFPDFGPSYTASKHGARAMSATINAEEGQRRRRITQRLPSCGGAAWASSTDGVL